MNFIKSIRKPFFVFAFSIAVPGLANAQSVVKLFKQAQRTYEKGNYSRAIYLYANILKKYPEYQPALVQMGKAFFRTNQYRKAYVTFRATSFEGLESETSYEYGMSHFLYNRFGRAQRAFMQVSSRSSLYDLSCFYAGLSAIQLGKFQEALDFLKKPQVLPQELQESKVLYEGHARKMLLIQEKKRLKEEQEKAKKDLLDVKKTKVFTRQKRKFVEKPKAEEAVLETPKKNANWFYHARNFARFSLEHKAQILDRHGLQEDYFRANSGHFHFALGASKEVDNMFNLGVNLDLAYERRNQDGLYRHGLAGIGFDLGVRRLTFWQLSDEPDLDIARSALSGFLEVALNENFYFGMQPFVEQMLVGFESEQGQNHFGLGTFLAYRYHMTSFRLNYQYEGVDDAAQLEPLTTSHSVFTDVLWDIYPWWDLQSYLLYEYFVYSSLKQDGPTSQTFAGVKQLLKWNDYLLFSLDLYGVSMFQYLLETLQSVNQIEADAIGFGSRLSAEAAYQERYFINASYEIRKLDFTVLKEEYEKDFEGQVPDLIQDFRIEAGIKIHF